MIRVRVPGSSANLGPGFDCFGVAWQCYNEIYFERQSEGLLITDHHLSDTSRTHQCKEPDSD